LTDLLQIELRGSKWSALAYKIVVALFLLLIMARFLVYGLEKVQFNANSGDGDQKDYLSVGLDIRAGQALTDGARNPLYPLLIAPFAERDWPYFTRAKLTSLAVGAMGVLVIFLLGCISFKNALLALLPAFLLSVNEEYLYHAATVTPEMLLVVTALLAWWFAAATRDLARRRSWAAVGFFTGLSYLSKPAGLFILFGFIATVASLYVLPALARKVTSGDGVPGMGRLAWHFAAFLGLFTLTTAVLLVYNAVNYGNPFYARSATYDLWLDRAHKTVVTHESEMDTAADYFRENTIGDFLEREMNGFREVWPAFERALIPARHKYVKRSLFSPVGVVLGVILLIAGATRLPSLWAERKSGLVFAAWLLVIHYLAYAWYAPLTIATRYFLPVIPVIYFIGVDWAWRLWQGLFSWLAGQTVGAVSRRRLLRAIEVALAVALYGYLAWWLATTATYPLGHLRNPFATDRELNADRDLVLDWLDASVRDGPLVVLWGSSHSLPSWKVDENRISFVRFLYEIGEWPTLQQYMEEQQVSYVMLDESTFKRGSGVLRSHFRNEGGRLAFADFPPGWALAFAYKGIPCDWCIFKTVNQPSIANLPPTRLGDEINLLGYELLTPSVQPGDTARLLLYWQAGGKIERDYTVFTHLLGPDGLLRGQMDRQPVNGLWPTSRWQEGDVVADRYDIPLDPDAPPGDYQVEVGMYLLETGERLPLVQGGERLESDRLLVGPVRVE
jgi:hypothetical protein